MCLTQVGPGEYNIAGARAGLVVPAAVPFHTSSEKVLCENTSTSAVTPGEWACVEELSCMHAAPSLGGMMDG